MLNLSLSSPAKIPFLSSSKFKPSNPSSSLKFSKFSITNPLILELKNGHLHKAISILESMIEKGSHPDLQTYSLLLRSCIRSRNFHLGRLVHEKLDQSNLELDSVTLNSLISLYSKSGRWEKAKLIFDEMGESKRDLISWSTMVSCFAINDMGFEALVVFLDMLENGYYPNEYCFSAVIRACSRDGYASVGDLVFGFVIKSGLFDYDICVGCALIDMFVKGRGDLGSAFKVFENMPERNAVTWTLMITRFMQFGYPREAIGLFLDMVLSGYEPNRFTLSGVVSACAKLELLSLGQQLHSLAIRNGLALDQCVGCCLVDMYAKCSVDGSMCESRKVFDQILDHNVLSWTAMITGYVQKGGDDEAVDLFCRMISTHVLPNHFTFSSTLKACANLADLRIGEQVFTHAVKLGFASVNCVGNSLISMYARSGKIDDARKAFDILFEKNLVSYNTVIDAYAKNLNSEEAFKLYLEIEDQGIGASVFTFASLLSGAASTGTIGKGEQIHARVLKSGLKSNQSICNALISMYSRCGNIEAAFRVFEDMEDRNVISWTSIITGFSKHGFATKALELFHEMLAAGIRPNEVTYIAVLSACSHVGLVDEGRKHFNSMYKDYGVVPRMEHYACMVDILGRSGSLSEAIEFINSMPYKADTLVWRTFLGACRVHGDLELGKHAAQMIIEQEPHDPAAYILLSNLYASTGQWEEVANIRKDMKERKLIKEAGCSWVEVENKVHKFYVGDTSHPKAEEIYEELHKLSFKIKKLGYIPNMDFVLHDVEEEQKEKYLFQHSEKIAVAFGLISTSKSKPIRVFKNLRICGDCHSAIKYISMANGREIIVRDANRFHHIKDGRCSCNEYW